MTTRTQLLDAVKAALLTPVPQTGAGKEVHIGRLTPVFEARMPTILIYAAQRRIRRNLSDPARARQWEATISIEVGAAGADAETTAETVAAEVERVLDRDPTLGQLAESLQLTEVETDADGDGQTPLAGTRLSYEAVYWDTAGRDVDLPPAAVVFDPEADDPSGEGYAPLARDAIDNGVAPVHVRRDAIEARLVARQSFMPGSSFEDQPALTPAEAATAVEPMLLVRETRILALPAIHRDSATRPGRTGVFAGHAPEVGPDHEDAYTAVDAWVNGE
ncbi:hypothetical protein [Fodinicurvata sp. EGI_FJ10296]|uniref:hypothetical protein n=1 Tax=Fodinicurvata sp. EGI_FJ10296 TaxID=3231908 RepID=UPI0034555218